MQYLECRSSDKGIWPEGTLLKRAKVSDELLGAFIEWQKYYDPAVIWTPIDFSNKNKYWIFNMQTCIRNEWVFNKKWELKSCM